MIQVGSLSSILLRARAGPELTDDLLRMLICVWHDDMPTLEAHFSVWFGHDDLIYPSHDVEETISFASDDIERSDQLWHI